ncbi:hypothetical protein ACFLXO_03465 [Chloroflexota bacterium]
MEKRRTIKSAPRTDTEISSRGTKVEQSTKEDWTGKLKDVL